MSLYTQTVFKHYKNPKHKGTLTNPTYEFEGHNPFCGDKLCLQVQTDSSDVITHVAWQGEGCAISQAAASIFAQKIQGLTLVQAQQITIDSLLAAIDMHLSPSRIKCALLPLYTLKEIDIEE